MSAGPGATIWLAMKLLAYDLILLAFLPLIAIWLLWRTLVKRKPIGHWRHRFGIVPRLPAGASPRIWVHAVSAGEMAAARPVVAELRRRFPRAGIALSTHTDTGMAVARPTCAEADAIFYFPFDWPDTMAIAMWRLSPQLLVVVEKELWPNFLAVGRLLDARVLVVNGRVSDRMVTRARWVPGFVKWLYRLPDRLCLQSDRDASRLRRLDPASAGRIVVAGNTKADTLAQRDRAAEEKLVRQLGIAPDELWLVAGSTHEGEEEQVVEAFLSIRDQLPQARLLLAPRHPERVAQVSAMVAERGLDVVRRSEGREERPEAVVVLDTMGELRAAYAFAAAGLVGGTLVPIGGHNLLEPPAVGVSVLFGPHTENCADAADLVLEVGVGFRVAGAAELAAEFLRIAANKDLRASISARATRLVAQQRGAAARCVDAAVELLGRGGPG